MWVQAKVKQALVGVDFVGDKRSGGTCLKSSRRLSTKIEGERRKRGRKKED